MQTPMSSMQGPDHSSRRVVVVMDDEKMVRDVACAILTSGGYQALPADSPEQAVEIARENNLEGIDAVVFDPGSTDVRTKETVGALMRFAPNTAFIVCSGSHENRAFQRFYRTRVSDFVQKPFTASRLRGAVDSVLSSHSLIA
jgi:two-component system, cell cycle sensor histidine kinase and response regulator CckA